MAKHKNVKITEQTVKSLKASPKPYFVRDTEMKGFGIKVNPRGGHMYRVEARIRGNGPNKYVSIGKVGLIKVADARNRARKLLQDIRDGKDPKAEKLAQSTKSMTLETLLDTFLKDRASKHKQRTHDEYDYSVRKFAKKWLKRQVADIRPDEIKSWYLGGASNPAHTDKIFRELRALFNHAEGMGVIESNPTDAIIKLKIRYSPKPRTRYLETEQLGALLEEFSRIPHPEYKKEKVRVSQDAADYLVLLLFTGLRRTEGYSLAWSDVDMKTGVFTLRDTKNRRDHTVPMSGPVKKMFERRNVNKEKNAKWVFSARRGGGHAVNYRKQFAKITKKLGVEFSPHDLRRTFATAAQSYGVDIASIKRALNHKSKDITEQYIQTNAERLRKTFDAVAEEILCWAFDDVPDSKLSDQDREHLKEVYADWDRKAEEAVDQFEVL